MTERPADISILVADDEIIIRERIALHLKKRDMPLRDSHRTAGEAAALISETRPDIVITDIAMPFVSGTELLEWARKNGNTAKFIFITGYDDFDFAVSALKNRANDYLLKPIDPTKLLTAVERACNEIASERKQRHIAAAYANLKEATALYRFLSGEDLPGTFSPQLKAILRNPKPYRLLLAYGPDCPEPFSDLHYLLPNGLQLLFVEPGGTDIMDRFTRDRHYLVLGNPLTDTASLRTDFPLLRRTLLERFFTPEEHRYRPKDFSGALPFPAGFTEENRSLIGQQQYGRLRTVLAEEIRAIDNPYALETYTESIASLFGEYSPKTDRASLESIFPLWILERFANLTDYTEYLQNVAVSLFPESGDTGIPLAERVRSFLLANYSEPQLNLETIGLRVFAHPNYVCTRFKEETGTTVVEYLNGLRLEKAKAS